MSTDLERLLNATSYRAFDIDAGHRILAGSDETGSTQLVEITPDGTVTALTALPGACTGRYLPGQRAVIVSHDDGGNERHQLSVLRLPRPGGPAGPDDLQPLVRDPRYMHTLASVGPDWLCYFTNRRDGVEFDPVIRDLSTGAERHILAGGNMLAGAARSPDGRWLALAVSSRLTANAGHVALVDLAASPAAEPAVTCVTPPDDPSVNHGLYWRPDSGALVFSSNYGREFTAVAQYELAGGRLGWLVTDDGADLAGHLSPDGTVLLVERNADGASVLSRHDGVTGARLGNVPLPGAGTIDDNRIPPPAWAPDSSAVTVTLTGDAPGDVLLAAARSGPARPVTRSAASLGDAAVCVPQRHAVPAPDGETIPCLVYPGAAAADPAVAGSAVLVVHGGPEAQARPGFNPYVQLLAAAGHTVLVPNVRGSTGYGKRWYSLDDGHRRLDAVADLAALHAYLPRLGLDPARAALWGGSYGGYMVLAGLAFQPRLWAAGVDIVGISSMVSFLENTSPYRRAYREREYGTLARDREFLREVSPLTRIGDVAAPLFIIHGANDPRVPLSEAEQIHAALTGRGQECELVVYPDEGHGLAKRGNRADAVPRALAFLARHLAA